MNTLKLTSLYIVCMCVYVCLYADTHVWLHGYLLIKEMILLGNINK